MRNNQIENLLSRTGDVALRRRARWILERIIKSRPKKILDIGCGDGFYLYLLSSVIPSAEIIGIDPDPKALKSAKRNLLGDKIELKKGSIYKLPFKDESFDLIIVSEVLEHLENDAKGISEVYRILRPSGLAFFSVPHANYPFFWDPINWVLERFMGTHIKSGFWAGFWNNHLRLYSQSLLTSKLKSSKFKSIETQILTSYCLPFNHHLLNLAARFLVNRKNSSIRRVVSKFNTNSKDGMLTVNPYGLFFWIDQLNNRTYGEIGVSLVSSVKK
ncbi:hypothetical protein A3C32_04385 [Candidatus Daviesbacteria bacterium RIFCSPHIGHO2_02_FULL_41_14]|uniref:Methyltransferase type 11 domain-containing protein n=1 Tax=Candidatus Daviesbacteria bacterium RIFCSPLOWO2_01_FULL_40_24 TaxID=1797787 RepID=A0A1F5MJD3_9BACT|nr:MAG: hypothetical protein A3C32_04385 [Candidatus Daviesbacteria bacterium RIFCSPHIGHO2_02_FULL_41_14]OGE65465.1 MAG: hypothetical protein A3B49_01080 [Candidatus Daviesbacteria bacterium RIFCSPLOWO2_01_FULL_40_24]